MTHSFPSPLRDDQSRLAESLEGLGLGGAAAFDRDACHLMAASRDFETASHVISHLVREVESSIRQSVIALIGKPPTEETPHENFVREHLGEIGKAPKSSLGTKLLNIARIADKRTTRSTHLAEINRVLDMIGAEEDLREAWRWLTGFVQDSTGVTFDGLHAWAHRDDLNPPRPVDDHFEKVWDRAEFFLRKIVERLEVRYDLIRGKLEKLLNAPKPGRVEARLLRASALRSPASLTTFFERLDNPAWVSALVEEGILSTPPGRVYDQEGRWTCPVWPQTRFLRRVAGDEQWPVEELVAAVRAVPVTDNQYVVDDLVHVALTLPATALGDWASTWLVQFLEQPDGALHFNLFADVSRLVAHLASGGQTDEALALARDLLRLERPPARKGDAIWTRREPVARASWSFYYKDGLVQDLPVLAEAAPWEALGLLSELIEFYTISTTDAPAPFDGSKHWLDDVAVDDDGSSPYEVGGWLARALCRTALRMVESGQATTDEILAWLYERGRHVYIRCALTLLREHGTPEAVGAALWDRHRVFEPGTLKETLRLIEDRLDDLSRRDRHRFLAVLAAGPDPEEDVRRSERYGRDKVTPGEARKRAERVREHWLRRLRPILPREWVATRIELFPESAKPLPDAPDPSRAVLDQIEATLNHDPAEGLTMLAEWRNLVHPPGLEATAVSLQRAVRANRISFATVAEALIGADATFIRAFAEGLGSTSQGSEVAGERLGEIEWNPVLQLFTWAVRQPREIAGRSLKSWDRDGDPHWGWARKRIARLLEGALLAGAIPWDLRDAVWGVLHPVGDDPDPILADDGEVDGHDAFNRAINSTRGDAIAAMFAVVIWAQRETGDAREAVPEAFEMLDMHLDPEVDPSPAVRAVYGRNLPILVDIARDWIEERRDRLFTESGPLRDGVWDGIRYIHRRDLQTINFLRKEYLAELDRLTVETLYEDESAGPLVRGQVRPEIRDRVDEVVEDMLQGAIGVEDGDVGGRLFGHPVDAVRALAVEHVGRLLRQSWGGHAIAPIRDRAVAAWERVRVGGLTAEIGAAFATWAPIVGFDIEWVLSELDDALAESAGDATDGYRLIEWLAGAATTNAEGAVRILDRLSHSGRIGLDLQGQADAARAVLRAAVDRGGDAAKIARAAANRLTVRTHIDFSGEITRDDDA